MKQVPAGTELARPFIPARDFALSKNFYEALGFEKVLDGDVAIFRAGSGGFILQPYYEKDWAENFMMQLMVDDLDAWCSMSRHRARRRCNHGAFGSPMLWIPLECFGTSANDARV
jgi:hypothetical protein